MPRPRKYTDADVLEAAMLAFWEFGYDRVSISQLEKATSLNRSSLYLHFGSKADLFVRVLDFYRMHYLGLISARSRSGGGTATFLASIGAWLRQDSRARWGCLLVNTAAIDGSPAVAERIADYRDLLRSVSDSDAFVASVFGIWILARLDPEAAADACDAMASARTA